MYKLVRVLDHSFIKSNFDNLVIVDLGSNNGEFYQNFKNSFGSFNISKYIGVEPSLHLYDKFLKNLNDNKTVYFENKLIKSCDSTHYQFIEIPDKLDCGNSLGFKWNIDDSKLNIYEVECLSFEKLISKYNLHIIHYLKIDIEGSEYELIEKFERNPNLIKNVWQISLEFHDFIDKSLEIRTLNSINILKKLGFELIYSEPLNYMNGTDYGNCVFLNSSLKLSN